MIRDVIDAIEDAGQVYDHTTGDHRIDTKPGQPGQVVVAGKPGVDPQEGTLTSFAASWYDNRTGLLIHVAL